MMRNLHVVFTMNPSGSGLRERASTSPALFNRCVLNWFGDWADSALYQVSTFLINYQVVFFQVGSELTNVIDMDRSDYEAPFGLPASCHLLPSQPTYRHAVINTLVHVHKTVQKLNEHVRFFIMPICLGKRSRVARNLNVQPFGIQMIFFSWKRYRTSFSQ